MLLSIIIPVYNVEKYIKMCLDSLLRQKTTDIEFICIDDGSTDDSGIICEQYAKKDKRFRIFHKKNEGVSSARNLGLKMAKGEYIAWVDPDDYISDEWYDNIKSLLNNNIDIVFFDYVVLKGKKQVEKKYGKFSQFIDADLFLKEIVIDQKIENQLWQKIFKKNLFDDIMFPQNVKSMEDYAVLHKIVLKAKNIYYLSKILYFYRIRNNSLVTKTALKKNYISYLIAKERYIFLLKENKDISKIGYLKQSLNVCIQYNKIKKIEQIKNKKIYNECKVEINKNISYILKSKECNFILKFKFLLFELGLLKVALNVNKFLNDYKQ